MSGPAPPVLLTRQSVRSSRSASPGSTEAGDPLGLTDGPAGTRRPAHERAVVALVGPRGRGHGAWSSGSSSASCTRSDLWLDEALSVNIARLPLGDMLEALRHDGHPPLYYLLLHGWMEVFGEGDVAVRALSGIFSVAALPAGVGRGPPPRRPGGARSPAGAARLSPYAIRYTTEARMYSLVHAAGPRRVPAARPRSGAARRGPAGGLRCCPACCSSPTTGRSGCWLPSALVWLVRGGAAGGRRRRALARCRRPSPPAGCCSCRGCRRFLDQAGTRARRGEPSTPAAARHSSPQDSVDFGGGDIR